ncbi:AraC family transcriptional regulator [Chryseobacterium formosus]|uniref:AraC family transcriptional regulator n=1 Tax=Chryseobacterium formosus TaxID=1537363 RepID=A0ABT3XTI3_9FLAO|nr:AraC family transcriptional regulator [Chryseobacterium formosus]MCX8524908.1 AraC family transcriptional regulator [Chryseobacterium formosus]
MKRKQFEPLEIDSFETTVYPFPRHSHTYYELVYISKGVGNHHVNQIVTPYKTGDLYLISPDDEHFFEIKKSTKFCFIKFNDAYFKENRHLSPDNLIIASPFDMMRNNILKEEKLIFDEPCQSILRKTVENIFQYNEFHRISDSPIVFFQILSLFGLIREASLKLNIRIDNGAPQKDDLISYIYQNIYSPEKIRIKNISEHFNISNTYFSAYFKRNFDVTYRKYITDYKLKLIERRIQSGQMTMKQIAFEFGFTDESHLTNYFKKLNKMNPSDFKLKNTA